MCVSFKDKRTTHVSSQNGKGTEFSMENFTDFRVKVIDFFKRNKRKIIIVLIIFLVILIINYALKYTPEQPQLPSTTWKPHTYIMDEGEEVPKKYQEKIENIIDKYFNYCNNKEYEAAYNLITEDCRKANYPTLEQFTAYVDEVFEGKKKIYNIQSYSNVDNKYVYNIRILDDILANGTTDGYYYYEEKFILIEENNEMKLSIAEYVGEENVGTVVEDDFIKVEVLSKTVDYETETYKIRVTNKTDYYVVIADNDQNNEIILGLDNGANRFPDNKKLIFYLNPNSSMTDDIIFTKFYDEVGSSETLTLGAIRIFQDYNWQVGTTEELLNSALRLYGMEIPLK